MNIKKESMELILTACKSIRAHLQRSKKADYDFRTDISDDIMAIETEAQSWINALPK